MGAFLFGVAGITDMVISSWRSQSSTDILFGGMDRKDSGQSMSLVGMQSHEGIKGKEKPLPISFALPVCGPLSTFCGFSLRVPIFGREPQRFRSDRCQIF